MKKLAWNEKNESLDDVDRIVLLIDESNPIDYWRIQQLVRENRSVFKECFNAPGDAEGSTKPTSRMLNYYLNVLEIFNKISANNGVFRKTEALKKEAAQIRERKP